MRLSRAGVSVELPDSWEGSISDREFQAQTEEAAITTLLQAGNFGLPAARGSFGSGATEIMRSNHVFVVLFEYDPKSANSPLFSAEGLPTDLETSDFDRNALQRALPGQSGLQRFFTHAGRAFCLYVVLGSHIDRSDLVPQVNDFLKAIEIE